MATAFRRVAGYWDGAYSMRQPCSTHPEPRIPGPKSTPLAILILILSAASSSQAHPADPALGRLVKAIVVENVSLRWEERKGWGDQVHVFDGLRFSGKGLRVKSSVRKKAVNHGLWKYYRVEVVDPHRDLHVRFPHIEYVEETGIRFVVVIDAHLLGYADFKQYAKGVKVFSAATQAEFDAQAIIEGVIGVEFVFKGWQSEIQWTPRVESVKLELPNVDVQRFGKIKGPLAQETGDAFRKLLQRRLQKQEGKLTEKINKAIQKKLDEGPLRLSLQGFVADRGS